MLRQELQELPAVAFIGLDGIFGETPLAGKASQPAGTLLEQIRCGEGQDLVQVSLTLHCLDADPRCATVG
ncbi:MAG: hypothetical protein ACOH2J_10055 [Allorhizobium sp.]